MRRACAIIMLVLLSLPVAGLAQFKAQQRSKINFASLLSGGLQPQGLVGMIGLDPSRFHMSQSYTLSFMNIGGQSFSQGVYLNTMSYRFNIPLTLNVQWGMRHSPLAAAGINSPFKNGFFLSGASLEYKPSKNFQIGVQYSTYPRYLYGGGLNRGWYRYPEE